MWGLRRLRVRSEDEKASGNAMTALEECVTIHATTLEFLHLDFGKTDGITDLCRFQTLEFPKLQRFYLKTNITFGIALACSVDILGLKESIKVCMLFTC